MENVLKDVGSCGVFQVVHVSLVQLPRFVVPWVTMLMMFGGYDPGWECLTGKNLKQTGIELNFKNGSKPTRTPYNIMDTKIDQSLYESLKVINKSVLPQSIMVNSRNDEWKRNGTCDMIEYCDRIGFDPGSKTIVTEFELICDRKWIVNCIIWIQSLGFIAGAIAGGQIGEAFGRKVSMYGGIFFTFLFCGAAIFSTHWSMYAACLFFSSFANNCMASTATIFSMEYLNSKWRGLLSSFPCWSISSVIFTMAITVMKSWIHVHIVICALTFTSCIGYFILPESVRWLVVNGHYNKAEEALNKIAKLNRKSCSSTEVLRDYKESSQNLTKSTYTYLDLFTDKEIRMFTVKFCILFFIVHVNYFTIGFGIKALPGNFYQNAIATSVIEVMLVIAIGPLCNRFGRRWSGVIYSLVGTIPCLAIVVVLYTVSGDTQALLINVSAFLAKGGAQSLDVISSLFAAEHFPTAVRNVSYGLFYSLSGLGALVAPFLIPSLDTDSFAICFSILSLSFGLGILVFLSLPETNKLCLTDDIKTDTQQRKREDYEAY